MSDIVITQYVQVLHTPRGSQPRVGARSKVKVRRAWLAAGRASAGKSGPARGARSGRGGRRGCRQVAARDAAGSLVRGVT